MYLACGFLRGDACFAEDFFPAFFPFFIIPHRGRLGLLWKREWERLHCQCAQAHIASHHQHASHHTTSTHHITPHAHTTSHHTHTLHHKTSTHHVTQDDWTALEGNAYVLLRRGGGSSGAIQTCTRDPQERCWRNCTRTHAHTHTGTQPHVHAGSHALTQAYTRTRTHSHELCAITLICSAGGIYVSLQKKWKVRLCSTGMHTPYCRKMGTRMCMRDPLWARPMYIGCWEIASRQRSNALRRWIWSNIMQLHCFAGH